MGEDSQDTNETRNIGSAPAAGSLSAGDVIGEYRILRPLGRGGMGEVYLAENSINRKRYALKALPPDLRADTQFVSRFTVESRVMADLSHPNIIHVNHMGRDAGRYYLTMDYVEGPDGKPWSLEDELARAEKLPESRVRDILLQICDAVAYAHSFQRNGVIHRDLKPANILLDKDGNVQVADFGLAKVLGPEYLRSVVDRSVQFSVADDLSVGERGTRKPTSSARAILGTYDYMSPEQKAGGEVGRQSDIYALGVMLYRMLTGRKPEGRWSPPSSFGCSRKWDRIVGRCMEPEPADRYHSVAALCAAVDRGRRRGLRLSVAAAVLGLLAVGAYWGDDVIKSTWVTGDVQRYLLEAQRNLLAGELEAAERRLTVVEEKDPGNRHAVHMRRQLEARLVEQEARNEMPKAHEAWERLEAMRLDRGQGIGERIDEIRAKLRVGKAADSESRWDEALGAWSSSIALTTMALQLADERSSAAMTRQVSMDARTTAREAQPEQFAKELWDASEGEANRAQRLFESGDFAAAEATWSSASDAYRRAARHARAVVAHRRARADFEVALAGVGREYLETWGGEVWAEIDKLARQGEAAIADPLAGAAAYRQALHKLPAAKAAADAAKLAADKGQRDRDERKRAYDAALSKARRHEEAGRWAAAKAGAEAAIATQWHDATESVALLERVDRRSNPRTNEVYAVELGNGLKLDLVWVGPGKFDMGSDHGDSDEKPVHRVELTQGFWLGRYEVTQESWKAVMGSNPSEFNGSKRPVEGVSWEDCQAFIKRLNERVQGGGFRLPTEAEWEYACRAGTTTKYNRGDAESGLTFEGWFDEGDDGQTHDVGQRPANGWGLYDMHGNVWEWCADLHGKYPPGRVVDPSGPSSGDTRVLRGGGWHESAVFCRAANRFSAAPGFRRYDVGFRIARNMP